MSELTDRVRAVLPEVRRDLEDLVRIESVWSDPARRDEVHRSADAVEQLRPLRQRQQAPRASAVR